MDYREEIIQRAVDANALTSISAAGQAINPNIWDTVLRDYETEKLIVTPMAQLFDFRGFGVDYRVTIDSTPTEADALVETDPISISAISTRNVVFTPTEYGAAFQVTDKEMNRAFFNTMSNFSKKLGYKLALKKDSLAVATARAGAGNTILANGRATAGDLVAGDNLGYTEIIDAARTIENAFYEPHSIVINNFQKAQLLSLDKVNKANEFGTRDGVAKGLVGELFGIQIFSTTRITKEASGATSTAKAIMFGRSGGGDEALGYAVKADPIVRTDIDILYRTHTIAAHEEYDFKVLHPNAICLVQTWSA